MTVATKARFGYAFLQGVAISTLAMAWGRRSTNTTTYETVFVGTGVLCVGLALFMSFKYKLNDPGTVAGQPRWRVLLTRYLSICAGIMIATFMIDIFSI